MTRRTYMLLGLVLAAVATSYAAFQWTGGPVIGDDSNPGRFASIHSDEPERPAATVPAESDAGDRNDADAKRDWNDVIANRELPPDTVILDPDEFAQRLKVYHEREAERHHRMQAYLDTVNKETLYDTVANLLLEEPSDDFQPFYRAAVSRPLDARQMEFYYKREPRVAKVWRVIDDGTELEKDDLYATLMFWIDYILTDVPLEPLYGVSHIHISNMGGAMMFPLMLAELAPSIESLNMIHAMYEREQIATATSVSHSLGFVPDDPVFTLMVSATAAAAERVFQHWDELHADGIALGAEESRMLESYQAIPPRSPFGGPSPVRSFMILDILHESKEEQ